MVKKVIWSAWILGIQALSAQVDTIQAVEIKEDQRGNIHDTKGGRLTTTLTENEFKKAACCTLSESFELSNTVEVSNKDGISGIRQVEMLGLAGKYVLMTRNNMPILGGIAQLNGLSNIPGAFVANVNIAKGNGSATLGFEGLTGGIDYELKSSGKTPRLFLNAYQNNQGRSEANVLIRHDFNPNLRNFTYLHGGTQWYTTDMNKDGFSDMPMTDRIYLGNQTQFQGKHTEGMFGVTFWSDNKIGGAMNETGGSELTKNPSDFLFKSNEQRLDLFAKLGIIPEEGETTFGNIFNFSNHRMNYNLNSLLGRLYTADETRFQYSGLMQSELTETWGVKAGLSFLASHLTERLNQTTPIGELQEIYQGTIQEIQTGIFGEAVYATETIKMVLGSRLDYHNYYGWLFTPRTHIKWDINQKNILFLQGGYGRRQAYVLAENIPLMINNRSIEGPFDAVSNTSPYGLNQERGWNYGISYLKRFMFVGYPSSFTLDVFRNQFDYRVVVDQERLTQLTFKGLSGEDAGFSESIHAEWSFIPILRLETRIAYRYVNNVLLLGDQMQMVPLVSQHRGLITVTYKTKSNWYVDLVGSVNGPKRIFSNQANNLESSYSPTYFLANTQIRKTFKSGWDFYIGVENIGNFRQLDPILRFPNNAAIDASYAWGPSNGRLIYAGFRFELN